MTPHSSVQGPECNPCTSKPSVFHVWFLSWQESVSTHLFLIFYHPYLKKFTLQKSHWSIFVSGKKFLLNDGCIWSGNFFGRFPLGSNCNRSGEETAFSKHRPTVCFQREPWRQDRTFSRIFTGQSDPRQKPWTNASLHVPKGPFQLDFSFAS